MTYERWLVASFVALVAGLTFVEQSPVKVVLHVSFLAGAFGSLALVVLAMRRHRPFMLRGGIAAVGVALVVRFVFHLHPLGMIGGAGLGYLAALVAWRWRASEHDRKATRPVIVAATLVPVFMLAGTSWTELTQHLLPEVLDAFVYYGDTTLPIHAFHVGRLFERVSFLPPIAHVFYDFEWLLMFCLWVRQLADPKAKRDMLQTTMVGTFVGVSIYYVFPVIGPVLALSDGWPHGASAGRAAASSDRGSAGLAELCAFAPQHVGDPHPVARPRLRATGSRGVLVPSRNDAPGDARLRLPLRARYRRRMARGASDPGAQHASAFEVTGDRLRGRCRPRVRVALLMRYGTRAFGWAAGLTVGLAAATVLLAILTEAKLLRRIEPVVAPPAAERTAPPPTPKD